MALQALRLPEEPGVWGPQPFSWASDLGAIRFNLAEPRTCHWALPTWLVPLEGTCLLPWAGSQPEALRWGPSQQGAGITRGEGPDDCYTPPVPRGLRCLESLCSSRPGSHRSQDSYARLGPSQRQGPDDYSQNPRGSSQGSGCHPLNFLTQGTVWGRLRPTETNTPEPPPPWLLLLTCIYFHIALLPLASDHPCNPICTHEPILIATQGVAANSTHTWPPAWFLIPLCPTYSLPCTFAGIKVVPIWGLLVASRSP